MDISFAPIQPRHAGDVHVVFVLQQDAKRRDPERLCGGPALIPLLPWLWEHPAWDDISGEALGVSLLYGPTEPGAASAERVVVVGLGEASALSKESLTPWNGLVLWRKAIGAAAARCRELKAETMLLPMACLEALAGMLDADVPVLVEEAVAGALGGLYEYSALKTKPAPRHPAPDIKLVVDDPQPGPGSPLQKALARGLAGGAGVYLARDLVNTPANLATPAYLEDIARSIATQYGYALEVYTAGEVLEMGMGAFAAVFQANPDHARLLVLDTHGLRKSEAAANPPLVLVGKGVTFDTGGISLKPALGMELMKSDMAGAAAILGCLKAMGELKATQRVVAILPATDNMPGPLAVRPGDVVKTLAGKTVEIINTDAEGRLLLCDALAYAGRYQPQAIIDLATLTGAAVVALGDHVAAIYGNHPLLAAALQRMAMPVGDLLWPMPLWDLYFEELKSEVADMKNAGTRMGGSAIAALFLKQFAPEGVPWVHLDIAGPAFKSKGAPDSPAGATGFATRTLLHLVLDWKQLRIGD
ncbi:leucyl aminopeptidase family protein [Megalodesulfovibrio paquesii]